MNGPDLADTLTLAAVYLIPILISIWLVAHFDKKEKKELAKRVQQQTKTHQLRTKRGV